MLSSVTMIIRNITPTLHPHNSGCPHYQKKRFRFPSHIHNGNVMFEIYQSYIRRAIPVCIHTAILIPHLNINCRMHLAILCWFGLIILLSMRIPFFSQIFVFNRDTKSDLMRFLSITVPVQHLLLFH